MILKVKVKGVVDGVTRIVATTRNDVFKYEGGVNPDMVEAMAGRKQAFFEAELKDGGLEIGDEVPDPGW